MTNGCLSHGRSFQSETFRCMEKMAGRRAVFMRRVCGACMRLWQNLFQHLKTTIQMTARPTTVEATKRWTLTDFVARTQPHGRQFAP